MPEGRKDAKMFGGKMDGPQRSKKMVPVVPSTGDVCWCALCAGRGAGCLVLGAGAGQACKRWAAEASWWAPGGARQFGVMGPRAALRAC